GRGRCRARILWRGTSRDAGFAGRAHPLRNLETRDSTMSPLKQKFEAKNAHVVVIGTGYVGLPLVAEFARAGFHVTGLDNDPEKVRLLGMGESYIADVPTADLAPHVKAGRLRATSDPAVLRE